MSAYASGTAARMCPAYPASQAACPIERSGPSHLARAMLRTPSEKIGYTPPDFVAKAVLGVCVKSGGQLAEYETKR